MIRIRSVQLAGTALVSLVAVACAIPAHAQVSPAPSSSPESGTSGPQGDDATIVVTGSRIPRPNLESNSPITVVGAEEIQAQGGTNIENVLNRLPQFTADANENVSNGSDGTAQINLRDLGSNRVLILLNGQRLLPTQSIDLNFVPSALVERVDVVTGGASAVYGSDAISGVVNFKLRDNMEGIRVTSQYSTYQHRNDNKYARGLVSTARYPLAKGTVWDGEKVDASISAGTNFADGRGNVTGFFGWRRANPVLQAARDVSSCAVDPTGAGGTGLICGGSSNNEFGLFTILSGSTNPNPPVTQNNSKDGSKVWVPYDSTFRFNTSPQNYLQRSDRRYNAALFGKYEIVEQAELYGSFMFMDDHTFSQAASSAIFQGTVLSINCNNPLASAQQLNLLCGTAAAGTAANQNVFIGYRLTGPGSEPRRDDLRHTDYRVTGGVRGTLAEGVRYDANYLRSIVLFNESYKNNVSDYQRVGRGLQVVNVNGVPTCRSVIDGTDPNCVPLDVFGFNKLDPKAYGYIYSPTFTKSTGKQSVLSGVLTLDGKPYGIASPWADTGFGAVLGVERRVDNFRFEADQLSLQNGVKNSDGKIAVTELFGELEIPLLEDVAFAKSLTINGGFRYSSYDNSNDAGTKTSYKATTYKAELDYAPVSDIRLRATYNHAIRAPNVAELFNQQQVGNVSAVDPCSGAVGSQTLTATAAQCALTGVTPAQYGRIPICPSDVCVTLGGGNPNVRPERANTVTVGTVLTPTFLPGFTASIDYFNIKVKGYIGSVDPQLAINQCIQQGTPFFCNLFNRDPRSGVLFGNDGYIIATTLNTGSLKTSGLDLGASYVFGNKETGAGQFDISLVGTYLDERRIEQLPGIGSFDCKGLFGPTCGQPTPEWRHNARVTWSMPWAPATLSLAWRYFGSAKLTNNTTSPFLKGTPNAFNAKIKAYNYFDLTASAEVMKDITVRAGVNNLFDKDPPLVAQGLLSSFGNGNTYPGVYEPLGRMLFLGITADF